MTFLLERAPPLVFLLLASGPCLSGLYTVQGYIDVGTFIWGLIGELVRWTEQKKTVFVNVHCICGTASHAVLPLNWLISHVNYKAISRLGKFLVDQALSSLPLSLPLFLPLSLPCHQGMTAIRMFQFQLHTGFMSPETTTLILDR